jgi:hypothetical protein
MVRREKAKQPERIGISFKTKPYRSAENRPGKANPFYYRHIHRFREEVKGA